MGRPAWLYEETGLAGISPAKPSIKTTTFSHFVACPLLACLSSDVAPRIVGGVPASSSPSLQQSLAGPLCPGPGSRRAGWPRPGTLVKLLWFPASPSRSLPLTARLPAAVPPPRPPLLTPPRSAPLPLPSVFFRPP